MELYSTDRPEGDAPDLAAVRKSLEEDTKFQAAVTKLDAQITDHAERIMREDAEAIESALALLPREDFPLYEIRSAGGRRWLSLITAPWD